MHLPQELKDKIDLLLHRVSLTDLSRSAEALSAQYRNKREGEAIPALGSEMQRLAYLVTRMPATYAVICCVLDEIRRRLPSVVVSSMADIGAGPGTALWAVSHAFSSLERATLFERDSHFLSLAKELSRNVESLSTISQHWVQEAISGAFACEKHDLFIASYFFSELPEKEKRSLLARLWEATNKILVVIEPGTPAGYREILKIREHLIEKGAHLIAPCPHANRCPMQPPDWCHFYARVERSTFHRQIKSGSLNFEDEKFSYVVFAKEAGIPFHGRILKKPQKKGGFIALEVCAREGIESLTVTRQSKEKFKFAKKADWGDVSP